MRLGNLSSDLYSTPFSAGGQAGTCLSHCAGWDVLLCNAALLTQGWLKGLAWLGLGDPSGIHSMLGINTNLYHSCEKPCRRNS